MHIKKLKLPIINNAVKDPISPPIKCMQHGFCLVIMRQTSQAKICMIFVFWPVAFYLKSRLNFCSGTFNQMPCSDLTLTNQPTLVSKKHKQPGNIDLKARTHAHSCSILNNPSAISHGGSNSRHQMQIFCLGTDNVPANDTNTPI